MSQQQCSQQETKTVQVHFKLNGRRVSIRTAPAKTLLRLLRDDFGLTGSKPGCEAGECGACTVLINGRAVTSCMVLSNQIEGHHVVTVEGLSKGQYVDPIIRALAEEGAVQCGYCIPGFVVAARGLLNEHPHPTPSMIRTALSGNVCRCGGYSKIFGAVERVAKNQSNGGH